jgi:hypothetical protein
LLRCDRLVKYAIALNDDGTPIYITNAARRKDYRCPECLGIVRRKGGKVRDIHFFHKDEAHSDHSTQSVIHNETRALIYHIFKHLLDTATSFVWTYECKKSNIDNELYRKYDNIPYNLNSQKDRRLLVADYRTKIDFLKGVDDVKWEFPFENGKFKPDVSLIHDRQLLLPIEIYHSHDDSEDKTAWYAANNYNVIKINVSTSSGITLEDIRMLRQIWEREKNPHTIFYQLHVTIIYNPPITCLIPQILTTPEMLEDNKKHVISKIENRKQFEMANEERERIRLEEARIKRKWKEQFNTDSRTSRNEPQQIEATIEYNVENERKRTETTKMEERIREIHTMVKTKIRDNTALNDTVIASALRRCMFTINDISHNLEGNSALRSALVLNIYNNQ